MPISKAFDVTYNNAEGGRDFVWATSWGVSTRLIGALVMARHPSLHSIGVTVLLGISAAIPAALFVIPALYQKKYE